MNELTIFKNDRFGEIRTMVKDGEPLFIAADVCKALEIDRTQTRRLDKDEKGMYLIHTLGGDQEITAVTESGLYSLVLGSRKPEAHEFKRWITHEVIPTIRKTGGYVNNDDLFINTYLPNADKATRVMFQSTLQTVRNLNAKIDADRPKVLFADAVSTSRTSILVGELAKLLKQNGIDIGQNRLFDWLRDSGYLIKRQGTDYNMPTQYSMERGWFEIKETSVVHSDGHTSVSKTPKITGKGQEYFINLFLGR